jgi:hypothetical protein
MDILYIAKLILGKRLVTAHDIASNSGINVESVICLSMNIYCFKKVVCPLGTKNVNVQPEGAMCGSVCQTSYQFELEENLFLERIVTYDL